jgi:hypothetical protein
MGAKADGKIPIGKYLFLAVMVSPIERMLSVVPREGGRRTVGIRERGGGVQISKV